MELVMKSTLVSNYKTNCVRTLRFSRVYPTIPGDARGLRGLAPRYRWRR